MKQLILVALISAVAFAEKDYDAMFRQFKSTHLKAYKDQAEESVRFKNFVANMRKAEVLQAANPLADFGANQFADMSEAEFASFLGGAEYYKAALAAPRTTVEVTLAEKVAAAGSNVDWRLKDKVSGVKNQGSCGSCWAYSALGNVESVYAIAKGAAPVNLSEQELTSCDTIDSGCNGGLMDNAFKWILNTRNGEIITEAAYPYTSGSGYAPKCKADSELNALPVGAVISGYNHYPNGEDSLAVAVQAQPTAIAVDATSFQSYKGGIVTACTNRQINHGVLAVGFNDENVPPYWIIKNSWGTSWGEEGYIRVAKGSNQCLVNQYITTAIAKV